MERAEVETSPSTASTKSGVPSPEGGKKEALRQSTPRTGLVEKTVCLVHPSGSTAATVEMEQFYCPVNPGGRRHAD